ncbi:MAG: TatD family hydrolase [Treponema sp.]|jgi:TatD DNase family protein|nr:TatD family hydrolase [Treponema sp.]
MLTCAHCHPRDLLERFPRAEEERRLLGAACAASATGEGEFAVHEEMARDAARTGGPPVLLCFAVHPQLPRHAGAVRPGPAEGAGDLRSTLETLHTLTAAGRLDAVGETGFDLYDAAYRETEAVQESLFAVHVEAALRHDLPLVLHVRRGMHKIFAHAKTLRRCRALIFHSWPGTLGEGEALLRRGINAFFSFGAALCCNHREAGRCCALFPPDRLLTETDAPWQPLRGRRWSDWGDLPAILREAAALRREAGSPCGDPAELEKTVEENFRRALMPDAAG